MLLWSVKIIIVQSVIMSISQKVVGKLATHRSTIVYVIVSIGEANMYK